MSDFMEIILLQPLMIIYQAIFDFPTWLGVGEKIIVFSIVLNIILSPAYRQMEATSRLNRVKTDQMKHDVNRMKLNFKGRERYFYIRAVHRQYNYHPLQALLSSKDLYLQIFVFFSVFHFLSELKPINGASFGRILDLGHPDGLLANFNLLPLLMTVINITSVVYYVKGKYQRIQSIALALAFLFFLYGSPAGLVLFWTTNNFWSLFRNMTTRKPKFIDE